MRAVRLVQAVDVHAEGEPGRVIVGGVLDVPGETMYAKMVYLRTHADDLRRRMLREPRGYPALCCNLILPPTDPAADAGFVIMEQTEYPGMSGSNTICVATVLLETGMLPMREPVTELDAGGARRADSRSSRVRQRQGGPRDLPQRPCLCGVRGRAAGGAAPGAGARRRSLLGGCSTLSRRRQR